MQTIPRDKSLEYLFDYRVSPKLRVALGESFAMQTWDASAGEVRSEADADRLDALSIRKFHPPKANPISGPVYVEGVAPGDTLVVTIERVEVAGQGATWLRPGLGPLGDSRKWQAVNDAGYVHVIKHLPGPSGTTRDGTGVFNERVQWKLAPFIGTIGVCPEWEVFSSGMGQGAWGGNLDVRDVKEGTKVHLPVSHAGALFWAGDVHGSQGDTEFTGTADESCATVQFSCGVIKGTRVPWIRLEKEESLIALHSCRPLEDAVINAVTSLMDWMVDLGMDAREAYLHPTLNPDFRVHVYQCVKLGYLGFTAGAEIPKRYLP